MSRRWKIAAALAAALFAAPAAAAPVPAKTAGDSAVVKARAALNKTVSAKGDGKTIAETVELFKDLTKAEITLDISAIQMMGMDVNQPVVAFELKDAKLKDAIKAAFGKFNLRGGVTSTGLVISTDEGIISRQLRERVSVEADGRSLNDVLKGLADTTGATVVVDPRAKKLAEEKVTLALDDVPLEAAVRLTAEVAGASVVRMSNVLFVTTEARADKLRPDADRPLGPTPGNPFFPIEPGIGGPGGGGFVPGGPGVIPPNVQVVPGVVERAQPEPVPPPKKEERKEEKKER